MSVLERLKITTNSEDNYDSEYDEEYVREFEPESRPDDPDDPRRDPAPGEAPARKPSAKGRRPAAARPASDGPRITKRMRDEAQEEIESLLMLGAALWGMQAPPVGEELERVAPRSAEIITRIVARNPKWLMAAREGSLIVDLITLAGVLTPVGKAAYAFYSAPAGGAADGVEFDPAQFPPFEGLHRG